MLGASGGQENGDDLRSPSKCRMCLGREEGG